MSLSSFDVCVRIPDLFSSIMAGDLRVNPNYFPTVRDEGYERIRKLLKKDDNWSAKNASVELGFLVATWAPTADIGALHTLFDYNHWVFLFDDQFDEGHFKTDPVAALKELNKLCDIMEGSTCVTEQDGANPLRYMWQMICDRVRDGSSPNLYERFKALHRHYFDGLLLQVQDARAGYPSTHSVEAYMKFRMRTIGVFAALPACEYAEGVDLPLHAYEHPSVQEIMSITAEIVFLVNDITSFKKDLALGVDFNVIKVLQREDSKLSVQQALEKIGGMLDNCYRRWYLALANMPIWGEETDYQVLRFVNICRDIAQGTLHWSFMTPRYFGESQGREVRKTRKLWLPSPVSDHHATAFDRAQVEIASLYADIAVVSFRDED